MRFSAIQWISTALALLGIYFSYRGRRNGQGRLINFVFWYFVLSAALRIVGLVETMAVPAQPSAEWIDRFATLLNRMALASVWMGLIDQAVLVYGCYDAQKTRSR